MDSLMEVMLARRKALVARRGLEEAWSKGREPMETNRIRCGWWDEVARDDKDHDIAMYGTNCMSSQVADWQSPGITSLDLAARAGVGCWSQPPVGL